MTADEIAAYCLQKQDAYIDFPFGEVPACIKVHSRIFAQIYPEPGDFKITLKCSRSFGEVYRQAYPGVVVRGYHCPPVQQPYWNTVYLNGGIQWEEVKFMIDHAYNTVTEKLPRKIREEMNGKNSEGEGM